MGQSHQAGLSAHHGNTFVAALRQLLLLFQLTGGPVTDVRSTLAPLWRLMRAFHLAVPPEFTAAVAVAIWAWVQQEIEFAVMVLMAHHCLLRPAEAQNIRVCDVVLLDREDAGRAPGVWGIVAVTAPKTRRLPSHTAVQHVLIEDLALADFLGWVLSGVPATNREQRLWQRTGAEFRNLWHEALNALQCADLHWQPAGLRGGGATEHFLRHRDVQGQRRRGRWTQLATLDRYLQEGVLLLAQRTEEAKRLRHLYVYISIFKRVFVHTQMTNRFGDQCHNHASQNSSCVIVFSDITEEMTPNALFFFFAFQSLQAGPGGSRKGRDGGGNR